MESNINFTNFVTKGFEAEEVDDRRIVKGHITAEVVDLQNEFVAVDEVMAIIKNYMEVSPFISDYHSNRMVGKALSYKKSEIGGHPSVYIEAEIFKKNGVTLYDKVWDKVQKRAYKGFSMGGASKTREPMVKDGRLIMNLKNLELYEIALCPQPANPLAVIDYVNEFAKASDLGIKYNDDGRPRIQCNGIVCSIEKAEPTSGGAYGEQQLNPNQTKKYSGDINKGTAMDSDNDIDVDHTASNKELKEMSKPVRGHDWNYWEKYLTSEEGGNYSKETAGKIIGKWEKDEKNKVKKSIEETVEDLKKDGETIIFKYTDTFKLGSNMTENPSENTEKVEKSEAKGASEATNVTKDYSNEISLLSTVSKQNVDSIAAINKNIDEVKELLKQSVAGSGGGGKDENPVDHGTSKQEKPKVSDNDDAGGKVKDNPSYAPDGNAQADIRAPADKPSGTDTTKVSKAENGEKKEEEKKEDKVEKSENGEKKNGEKKEAEKKENEMNKSDKDSSDIKKSISPDGFEYEIVKAVRPKVNLYPETPDSAPTGYQILKAIDSGWNGKHKTYEGSFTEAYTRFLKGEFGSGLPGGLI